MNGIKNRRKTNRVAYLWLAIPMLVVAVFCVYPAISAIIRSFMEWTPSKSKWIWLKNYKDLFQDKLFFSAFKNMSILLVFNIITGNVMTLFLAELLFNLRWKKTEKVFRYLFLLPALVPGMVNVLLWKNVILSSSEEGLVNIILSWFGKPAQGWYFDKSNVILSLILTSFPWWGKFSYLLRWVTSDTSIGLRGFGNRGNYTA